MKFVLALCIIAVIALVLPIGECGKGDDKAHPIAVELGAIMRGNKNKPIKPSDLQKTQPKSTKKSTKKSTEESSSGKSKKAKVKNTPSNSNFAGSSGNIELPSDTKLGSSQSHTFARRQPLISSDREEHNSLLSSHRSHADLNIPKKLEKLESSSGSGKAHSPHLGDSHHVDAEAGDATDKEKHKNRFWKVVKDKLRTHKKSSTQHFEPNTAHAHAHGTASMEELQVVMKVFIDSFKVEDEGSRRATAEGIFRLSGNADAVKIQFSKFQQAEGAEAKASVMAETCSEHSDVHVCIGVMKKILVSSPRIIVTQPPLGFEHMDDGKKHSIAVEILKHEDPLRKAILADLVVFLNQISANSGKTKMTPDNLAIAFAQNLFEDPLVVPSSDPLKIVEQAQTNNSFIHYLIEHPAITRKLHNLN